MSVMNKNIGNSNEVCNENSEDLSIGIWIHDTPFWKQFSNEFNNQKQALNIDISIHNDNNKSLISEDIYNLFSVMNNLCLIGTNFNYKTHLEKSTIKKHNDQDLSQSDICDQSPSNSISNSISSYKSDSSYYDLHMDEDQFNIAIIFILLTKDDLKGMSFESLQKQITTTIESLRAYQPNSKIILIMNGLRNVPLLGNVDMTNKSGDKEHVDNAYIFNTSMLDELICLLLIHYNVDTIETEDIIDMTKFMINACTSIDLCFSRTNIMKFKSKPHDSSKEELPKITKIWITQLLQIPDVGRETAKAISNTYSTPSDVIKAIIDSHDKCLESLKNINLNVRSKRKLGSIMAKRVATLYSYNLVPDCHVYESND